MVNLDCCIELHFETDESKDSKAVIDNDPQLARHLSGAVFTNICIADSQPQPGPPAIVGLYISLRMHLVLLVFNGGKQRSHPENTPRNAIPATQLPAYWQFPD